MGRRQYYWRLLTQSYAKAFNIAGIISFVITVIGGGIALVYPNLMGAMTFLFWVIPLAVFIVTGCIAFIFGSFWFYKKAEAEKNLLINKAKPKLKVLNRVMSNRSHDNVCFGLLIKNEGSDEAQDCRGFIEKIEFVIEDSRVSLRRVPQNQLLKWRDGNDDFGYRPIGNNPVVLDVVYTNPETLSRMGAYLAYFNDAEYIHNISFDSRDVLLVVSVASKDTLPLYTVCYFRMHFTGFLPVFEILQSNLPQCPSIHDCRQILAQNRERIDNILVSPENYGKEYGAMD